MQRETAAMGRHAVTLWHMPSLFPYHGTPDHDGKLASLQPLLAGSQPCRKLMQSCDVGLLIEDKYGC